MFKKSDNRIFYSLIALCAIGILLCLIYLAYNYWYLPRQIQERNEQYVSLYDAGASPSPEITSEPTPQSTPEPTAEPTPEPTPDPTPEATAEPTMEPTTEPTREPSPSPAAVATVEPQGTIASDFAFGTPDPETLVIAAMTPPPIQSRFEPLLSLNPETVAFLTVGENIALPVVQRENDNEFYLDHDFEGAVNNAGCLFLDGANWLYPRDECLYVYGHNMKNGAMFGHLSDTMFRSVLIDDTPVAFDTLYESGLYVPFSCFAMPAEESEIGYMQLRHFDFDEESFDSFVTELRESSLFDIPVDVQYGDELLMLVTCNYSSDNSRFILALRRMRDGETADGMKELVSQAVERE